jgi:hypothetical protein
MSTIKGDAVISYDIPHSHALVKNSMKNKGYHDKWNYTGNSKTYMLPNTTLWKSNTSTDDALADLKASCNQVNVKLEKVVCVLGTEWVGYNI